MRLGNVIGLPILLAACAAWIGGCAPFAEQRLLDTGYRVLQRDEIRTALAGNTVHGTFYSTRGQSTGTVFLTADGQVRGRALTPAGTYESDQGRWQVTDEHLFCDQWARWQEASDCDRIYLRGQEVVFVNRDGSISGEGTIEPGNARGL